VSSDQSIGVETGALRRGARRMPRGRLFRKHDGLAAVKQNSVLKMVTHGPRQNAPFDVASLAHQVIRCVAMGDTLDVLLDNGPFIEI
jgi:hypothetical protein